MYCVSESLQKGSVKAGLEDAFFYIILRNETSDQNRTFFFANGTYSRNQHMSIFKVCIRLRNQHGPQACLWTPRRHLKTVWSKSAGNCSILGNWSGPEEPINSSDSRTSCFVKKCDILNFPNKRRYLVKNFIYKERAQFHLP